MQHFLLTCPLYQHIRHDLFTQVSHVLGPSFLSRHPKDILQTLTHGQSITSTGDGREVAALFQGFVMRAMTLRQAAEAAAEVATDD